MKKPRIISHGANAELFPENHTASIISPQIDKQQQIAESTQPTPPLQLPDFESLLKDPLLKTVPLPKDFNISIEANHLRDLWGRCPGLQKYLFKKFIMAGGSGMTFEAQHQGHDTSRALKIARVHLFNQESHSPHTPTSLSPVSQEELQALEKISHPNVVRLYESISEERHGIVALSTTFVENPRQLDQYLLETLSHQRKQVADFSPQRLEDACSFFIARFLEIASALAHMHAQGLFHMDIKPANVLISSPKNIAVLTDLGSCIDTARIDTRKDFRVHFTWTYGHPELRNVVKGDVSNITGAGLKVAATVPAKTTLGCFDLFAFGRSIQEILASLDMLYGERAYASYSFRYLHLIASLLLDGQNNPLPERKRLYEADNRNFVSDTAMDYPTEFCAKAKITSAKELEEKLSRWSPQYSWNKACPELDLSSPDLINTGIKPLATFTKRVARVANHPAVQRLKREAQLGWIREVYPGATHNRWSHSIGVCGAMAHYYNAILHDPEVPTGRICLDSTSIEHGMIAALLHDLGQTEFGHDFESACPDLFDHEIIIARLLGDKALGSTPLAKTITELWPSINIRRVLGILSYHKKRAPEELETQKRDLTAVDGLTADMISGPIDADKFDYVRRDAIACGVPYGCGIDENRFFQALSVDRSSALRPWSLSLAYKAKASAAVEALIFARYLMYGSVYWHHTFRCLKSMFLHATAQTFQPFRTSNFNTFNEYRCSKADVREMFYHHVVTEKPRSAYLSLIKRPPSVKFFESVPPPVSFNRALSFVYAFADEPARYLLSRIATRGLYKRLFELRVRDLGEFGDFSEISHALDPINRMNIVTSLQKHLISSIDKRLREKALRVTTATGARISPGEVTAADTLTRMGAMVAPLLVVDFTTEGVPDEKNFPREIGDWARKYMGESKDRSVASKSAFSLIRTLQVEAATLRVYAEESLHMLVTRYLGPNEVRSCVNAVLPMISTGQD